MINVNFVCGLDKLTTEPLTQWDYGQKLNIYGLDLPQEVQVHFCDKSCTKAIVRIASKVAGPPDFWEVYIPDSLLENKWEIHAFLFLNSYEEAIGVTSETTGTYYTRAGTAGDYTYTAVTLPDEYAAGTTYYRLCGKTTKSITIPVQPRTQPDELTPEDNEAIADFLGEAFARIDQAADYLENLGENASRIRNIKDGSYLDTWVGTEAEYDALPSTDPDTMYLYDNQLQSKLEDGTITVMKAQKDANGNSISTTYARNDDLFATGKPLSGYDETQGTIEERLTALDNPTLADLSPFLSINNGQTITRSFGGTDPASSTVHLTFQGDTIIRRIEIDDEGLIWGELGWGLTFTPSLAANTASLEIEYNPIYEVEKPYTEEMTISATDIFGKTRTCLVTISVSAV